MAKRVRGSLWIVSVITVLIAAGVLAQAGGLAWVDAILNGGRVLVPAGIALAALGGVLLVAAMTHGFATDARHDQTSLTLEDRVVGDTPVAPGKVKVHYRGRSVLGNQWVRGYFRVTLLWGAEFSEESGMSELKRSLRSGEWLHVHRYLRATLALSGFLLMLVGILGTAALLSDITAVRLLLLIVVAYALVRTAYTFARA